MSGFAMKRWQTALVAFFTIAASLLAGCSKATDARLVAADSLMAAHPDSALAILQEIAPESLRGKANNAYYALLLTQAQYKNYVPITSDSLIDVAVRYYDDAGDAEKRTRAYIFKGAALKTKWATILPPSNGIKRPKRWPIPATTKISAIST